LAATADAKYLDLRVVAYNPGFTPGTTLFRAWPLWARIGMRIASLLRLVTRFNSVEQAGTALADLAMGLVLPPQSRVYASLSSKGITVVAYLTMSPQQRASSTMTPYLIAAREGIICWVTLTLMPIEVVFDWLEDEIERQP
jgi:hypothetical protein